MFESCYNEQGIKGEVPGFITDCLKVLFGDSFPIVLYLDCIEAIVLETNLWR